MKRKQPRYQAPPVPDLSPPGGLYEAIAGGAMGCKDLSAFARLAQSNVPLETGEKLAIMDECGCFPTLPGAEWRLVNSAPALSTFMLVNPLPQRPAPPPLVLWFRNDEMVPKG